jgi:hypothetical protein
VNSFDFNGLQFILNRTKAAKGEFMAQRTIHLTKQDEEKIADFLVRNPMINFSSIARTAILDYIGTPQIKISKEAHQNFQNSSSHTLSAG